MSSETPGSKVLVRSEQSGGRLGMAENYSPAHSPGPPFHLHDFDEAFYVLEGELTFRVGDELLTAGAGELVFAPGGTPHTVANRSDAAARYVLVVTPGGFEREFARREARREGVDPPEWAMQPIPEVKVIGPRIGEEEDAR